MSSQSPEMNRAVDIRRKLSVGSFISVNKIVENDSDKLLKDGYNILCREYLKVGYHHGSITLAKEHDDIPALSVSLILSNKAVEASAIIETAVVIVLATECIKIMKLRNKIDLEFKNVLEKVLYPDNQTSIDFFNSLPVPTDNEFQLLDNSVRNVVSFEELNIWYLISMLLQENFNPPKTELFSRFLGVDGVRNTGSNVEITHSQFNVLKFPEYEYNGKSSARIEVENILISKCHEAEILLVQAYVSFMLRRYRSAVIAASCLLKQNENDASMRFIRCISCIHVSDRNTSVSDCQILSKSKSRFVCAAGLAIAAHVLPNPHALEALKKVKLSDDEENYILCLSEWVHALLLLQFGYFSSSLKITQGTAPQAPDSVLQVWLHDVALQCCVGLGDAKTMLQIPLTPYRQLYLSLIPYMCGGFSSKSFGFIPLDSSVGLLFHPQRELTRFTDIRHAIPLFYFRAHSLYKEGRLEEAWQAALCATAAADEVIGSVELSLCDCAPHRVFLLAIKIGIDFQNSIIIKEGDLTLDPKDVESIKHRLNQDAIVEEILCICKQWAKKIIHFHPKMICGYFAYTYVSIYDASKDTIQTSVNVSDAFPESVLAQVLLPYAYHSKLMVLEANDAAKFVYDDFNQVPEIKEMANIIIGKNATYVMDYRYIYGINMLENKNHSFTGRKVLITFITFIQFVLLILVLIAYAGYPQLPQDVDGFAYTLNVSTIVPTAFGLFIILYSIIDQIISRSLTSLIFKSLCFKNTRLQRVIYTLRCLGFVNLTNAALVQSAGGTYAQIWYGIPLVIFLIALLIFPVTTRFFFLDSVDEMHESTMTSLTILLLDLITYLVLFPLHALMAVLEPFMYLLYFFFMPKADEKYSLDIRRRLERYARNGIPLRSEFEHSNYIHIVGMKVLYAGTFPDMSTKYKLERQDEEDNYRIFPLLHISDKMDVNTVTHTLNHHPDDDSESHNISDQNGTFSLIKDIRLKNESLDSAYNTYASHKEILPLPIMDNDSNPNLLRNASLVNEVYSHVEPARNSIFGSIPNAELHNKKKGE